MAKTISIHIEEILNPLSVEHLTQVRSICQDFEYFDTYIQYFSDPYYRIFGAINDQQIIGIFVLARHSFWMYGTFFWVDHSYRNRGVGSAILKWVDEYVEKSGARALCGDTLSSDSGAQRLYEWFGASKFGEYINFFGDGKETMYMFRKLYPTKLESHPR
jgi:GNAT superfamily N-acetyltransferase